MYDKAAEAAEVIRISKTKSDKPKYRGISVWVPVPVTADLAGVRAVNEVLRRLVRRILAAYEGRPADYETLSQVAAEIEQRFSW